RVHSIGRYLVGFAQVERSGPTASDTQTFLQDDDIAGLALESTHSDRLTPEVLTFESRQYGEQVFQGLRWMRPISLRRGDKSANGSLSLEERTDWISWQADFCPAEARTTDARGTLTVDTIRADIPALSNSLHCVESGIVQ